MPFGITFANITVLLLIVFFYAGLSIFWMAVDTAQGRGPSQGEIVDRVNPVRSLDSYNKWLYDSYMQMKATSDTITVRNAYFGLAIAGIAVLVLWMFVYLILYVPIRILVGGGDADLYAKVITFLISGLFFSFIGGFSSLGPILGDLTKLFPISAIGSATVGDMQRRKGWRSILSRLKSRRDVS